MLVIFPGILMVLALLKIPFSFCAFYWWTGLSLKQMLCFIHPPCPPMYIWTVMIG